MDDKNGATVTTNLPSNVPVSRDHDVELINPVARTTKVSLCRSFHDQRYRAKLLLAWPIETPMEILWFTG